MVEINLGISNHTLLMNRKQRNYVIVIAVEKVELERSKK